MSSAVDDSAALRQSLLVASQTWSKFDLDSRRPLLDRSAAQAKESREQSQAARKELGNLTKGLKKQVKSTESVAASLGETSGHAVKSIEALAKECRGAVKAYQEEIDNLTRRCKASDSAFLTLYQGLYELADPATILVPALEHVDAREAQVSHLLRGMDEMNGEMESTERENERLKSDVERLMTELSDSKIAAKGAGGGEGDAPSAPPSSGLSRAEREELIQLRSEVAEYEVEFRGLKNQDITIRKLEAKIAELQRNSEEELQEKLKKAQEELAESEGRRAAEALEREAAMERRVQSLELELRAERAGREATQAHILEADEGAGEREAAWEAQRQILVDDAERLRETLHEATRERDSLRLKVEALPTSSTAAPSSGPIKMAEIVAERTAYEAEVNELTLTASALRDELRAKDERFSEETRAFHAKIEKLEQDRSALSSQVASLEAQVASAPSQASVESMRRELRILKRLEYNAVDADAEKDPEMTTGGEVVEDDLETVLVAKLRKMEADLVRERREKADKSKECEDLMKRMSAVETAKEAAEELVARLEADLEKAITTPITASPGTISRKSSFPMKTQSDPSTLEKILDPNAPQSDHAPLVEERAPSPPPSAAASEKANDDHSVATIVMAQRDRLRARCDALEAERDSFKRELQVQVQSSESLKADNTKLYEKVRYLQNFSNQSGSSGSYARSRSNLSDRDLDLEALEQRYEASVDPFRQFSRAERQRKLNEMTPMERIVFIVAKTFLATKELRTALFMYVLAMHLLVFITTYHWSHELGCDDLHNHEALAHFHGGVPLTETASNRVAQIASESSEAAEASAGGGT